MISEVLCPNDKTPYWVDDSLIGKVIICVECGYPISVEDELEAFMEPKRSKYWRLIGLKIALRKMFGTSNPKVVAPLVALLVFVALFAWLVWPTPFRYDHTDYGRGTSYLVKQNRLTGWTQVLFPEGWRTVSEEEFGSGDLSKLEVHADLFGGSANYGWGEIHLSVYNGSALTLKEITIELFVSDSNKVPVAAGKLYRARGSLMSPGISPLQTGTLTFDLGFAIKADYAWSFRVVSAKGTRS